MTRQHCLWLATPMFEPDPLKRKAEYRSMPKADRIAMQGWLKKQKVNLNFNFDRFIEEGMFGHWRERWCVIYESGLFRYYSQAPGPDGEFDESKRKGKGDVSFLRLKTFGLEDNFVWLGTSERMWRFDAGSAESAKYWLDAMTAPYQRWAEDELNGRHQNRSPTKLSFSEESQDYEPLKEPPRMSTKFKCVSPSQRGGEFAFTPVYRTASILRTKSEPCLSDLEPEPKTEILKEGWLLKKGGHLGIWRKRWCVLYECGLFRYYTSPDKTAATRKGKGDMSFAIIRDGRVQGNEFWVQTDQRLWEFQATSLVEATEWLDKMHTPSKNARFKAKSTMDLLRRESESFSVWGKRRAHSASKISELGWYGIENSLVE